MSENSHSLSPRYHSNILLRTSVYNGYANNNEHKRSFRKTNDKNIDTETFITLNDRFVSLIERVQTLEIFNNQLRLKIGSYSNYASIHKEDLKLGSLFHQRIQDLNDLSIRIESNRKLTDKKVHRLNENANNLYRKVSDKYISHNRDNSSHLNFLNTRLSKTDFEMKYSKRRLNDLENEIVYFINEIQFLNYEIVKYAKDLNNKMIITQQLEIDNTRIKKELALMKKMQINELNSTRNFVFKNAQLNSGMLCVISRLKKRFNYFFDLDSYFDIELSKNVQKIRDEHEEKCKQLRIDTELSFKIKIEGIQRAKVVDLENQENLKLKHQITAQKRDNSNLKVLVNTLKTRIDEIKEEICKEKLEFSVDMREKNCQNQSLKNKLDSVQTEFEILVQTRMSLQDEINTYRKLFEGGSSKNY